MRTKLCSIGLAAQLFLGSSVSATPSPQQNTAKIDKLRQQVAKFEIGDPLTVRFRDKTEVRTCLKSVETDAFVIAYPTSGVGQTVPYADVAGVKRERTQDSWWSKHFFQLGVIAGLVTGWVMIGSNTPKTIAAKVPATLMIMIVTPPPNRPARAPRCK